MCNVCSLIVPNFVMEKYRPGLTLITLCSVWKAREHGDTGKWIFFCVNSDTGYYWDMLDVELDNLKQYAVYLSMKIVLKVVKWAVWQSFCPSVLQFTASYCAEDELAVLVSWLSSGSLAWNRSYIANTLISSRSISKAAIAVVCAVWCWRIKGRF